MRDYATLGPGPVGSYEVVGMGGGCGVGRGGGGGRTTKRPICSYIYLCIGLFGP